MDGLNPFAYSGAAMRNLVNYTQRVYGLPTTVEPVGAVDFGINIQDTVSLTSSGSKADPLSQARQLREMGRRFGAIQSLQSQGLPAQVDPLSMSNRDFQTYLDQQVGLLRALKANAQSTGSKSADSKSQTAGDLPLNVQAHDRYKDGERIPVTSVTIHEAGNWRSRETDWNTGGYSQADASYSKGKKDAYYTVTVNYAEGPPEVRQVRNDGSTVNIY